MYLVALATIIKNKLRNAAQKCFLLEKQVATVVGLNISRELYKFVKIDANVRRYTIQMLINVLSMIVNQISGKYSNNS